MRKINFITYGGDDNNKQNVVRFPTQRRSWCFPTMRKGHWFSCNYFRPNHYGLSRKFTYGESVGRDAYTGRMASNHQNRLVGALFNPLNFFSMNMEKKSCINIIFNILYFKQQHNKWYPNFYVGITDDVERRLREHNVNILWDDWICFRAYDRKWAKFAESYLLNDGMRGNPGGGNSDSVFVYCYVITPYTRQ